MISQVALKGGRKVVQRLEQKIREMEGNLDDEQRRLVENQKHHRRIERRIKELTFQQVSACTVSPNGS